jgi:signal transduction histidine kinase
MKLPRAWPPFAVAGALALACASVALGDVIPGVQGLPSGPIVPAADASDELVELSSTIRPVLVSEHLRVHVEGPAGAPSSMFDAVPDRRLFSRLPVSGWAGLGGVLRDEPFADRTVWLAFTVSNLTDDDFFSLVADGSGFAPSAMVIVSGDGSSSWYSGLRLRKLRYESSVADATAYRFMLPPDQRCTVYMRLDGYKAFGPGLSVWPSSLLAARVDAAAWLLGLILGIAAAFCLVLFIEPLRRAFSISVFLSLALGLRGGGISALLAGDGLPRYLVGVLFGIIAMALDTVVSFRAGGGRSRYAALFARVTTGLIAVIGSFMTTSPATSFILPAYLFLRVSLLAASAAVGFVRRAGSVARNADLLRERLWQESEDGRNFITATATALSGPLYGIVGMLEDIDALLSDIPLVSRNALADIGLARAEAARIDTMVSNMLSYAGGGIAGLSIEDFDLASVAGAAANLLRMAFAGRVLHIDTDVPIIEMRSDVRLVRQLLYNAMHWAARSGSSRVIVKATSTDQWSQILIEDDGLAVPAADAVSIAALDMDTAVMTRLARLLGGGVSFRSDGPRNTRVIDLPRWMEAPVSLPGIAASLIVSTDDRLSAGHPMTAGQPATAGSILVAGNEPVTLLAVKRRLEASGWAVVATVSARDALARVMGDESFDLVIVDSVMPEMSGFEFCASIRASRGLESVPVIILVESGRPDEIEQSFKAGANDYIARPASGLELAARVKTHVDLASSIRRELAQAAKMAELDKYRTLAMLSAGVAHEINTPNNAVLRNVPMLKEIWSTLDVVIDRINREEGGFMVRGFGYDDLKREIPDMLNDLYMGAQDIRRIVEGLKDYARSPSGAEDLGPVDVNEVVQYAMRLLKHSIVVATDQCTLSLQDGLPHIQADRLKLTQVVVNVLENALQALPDRSRGVTITTMVEPAGEQRESIVVRIVDDGVGMSAETLASVFDPFFTTKRDKGGSGLGMAVVSGIVHDVGGSITLSSVLGGGTTVTIRIPVGGKVEGDDHGQ